MIKKLENVLNKIWHKSRYDSKTVDEALEVYAKYFGIKKVDLNCAGCMRNMTESLKSLLRSRKFAVTTKEYYDRKDICKKCKHYWEKTDQCGQCKCFLFIKANLKTSKCPKNHW